MNQEQIRTEIESFSKDALARVRRGILEEGIAHSRLPSWFDAASIRSCLVGNTAIVVFEDASENTDLFSFDGSFLTDTCWLFSMPHLRPQATSMENLCKPREDGYISFCCKSHPASVILTSTDSSLIDSRLQVETHFTVAWCNTAFALYPDDRQDQRVAHRHVPLMLWVSTRNLPKLMSEGQVKQIVDIHRDIAAGTVGDLIEQRAHRIELFKVAKQRGVIVLGSYSGPYMQELIGVRDSLRNQEYEAEIISLLPDIDSESNLEKVQRWTLASRFVVMVDRVPAGHLAEYPTLRQQKTIVALLRQAGVGSTWMIGDDQHDLQYIRTFEFANSPLEVLRKAVTWAEKTARGREAYFNNLYPWRRPRSPLKRKPRKQ